MFFCFILQTTLFSFFFSKDFKILTWQTTYFTKNIDRFFLIEKNEILLRLWEINSLFFRWCQTLTNVPWFLFL